MKIATTTIFCNEGFRLQDWIKYYFDYKDDIAIQVIVNNGDPEDNVKLHEVFPNAVVLQSKTKNMIASYNLGISYILDNTDADAILQITNDLRIERGGIKKLYDKLYENEKYGLISPVILEKDSEVVEVFGCSIDPINLRFQHLDSKKKYDEIKNNTRECSGLPGGCFMIKPIVYKTIGLQDEKINMYADEVDLGIRVAMTGFVLIATSFVKAWHQHIYEHGRKKRNPMAYYYLGRNHIYIAKKLCTQNVVKSTIMDRLKICLIEFLSSLYHLKGWESFSCNWYFFKGVVSGIFS